MNEPFRERTPGFFGRNSRMIFNWNDPTLEGHLLNADADNKNYFLTQFSRLLDKSSEKLNKYIYIYGKCIGLKNIWNNES